MTAGLSPLSAMLLLETVLALSWPTFDRGAARLLTERDNFCPSGNYTSRNGLQFQAFCLHNVPFYDIIQDTADNMKDCMDQCSASAGEDGQVCWGIAYNFDNQKCYHKNKTIVSTTPVADSQTHSAFALNIDAAPDTACPWTNATAHSTPNGMDFEIICNQDLRFDDFCPWDGPTSLPNRSSEVCPYHADSLEDCMELCSKTHPACKSVTYNPDMEEGYGNCYPKSDFPASNYVVKTTTPTVHMAVAANWPTLDASCANGSNYTAPNSEQFAVTCNNNRPGNDLIQVHSANLSYCIDSCASYSNATGGDCLAVVYDSTLDSGWLNCWLKSKDGASLSMSGLHYALKVAKAPGTPGSGSGGDGSGDDGSGGDSSGNKAWIAGPVVGAVVGVALIGAGIVYFRRKRSRKNLEPKEAGHELSVPAEANNANYAGDANKLLTEQPARYEADASETPELPTGRPTYELPAYQ